MVSWRRRRRDEATDSGAGSAPFESNIGMIDPIPIPPGDPLETALVSLGRPVEVSELEFDSPALSTIRQTGVKMIVPLVGQGELLGVLYLGHRLSDQVYSADDRRLLKSLSSQVAPAMKVAQLVRTQQTEAKERERIQQELEVAALIQHTLLPKELPSIPGWHVDAFYRPARAVGGDFYDFIDFGRGRQGVVIGDVTDKGVPAALVMATCRSMLRAAAQQEVSPGKVLADVNDNLVDEIPPAMFVTCLYAIIDTTGGEVVLANAGHNLPYVRSGDGVVELRATGMPLGLMPGMTYDEKVYQLGDGDVMVLTSDGITEAHNPDHEMYGFARLMGRVARKVKSGDVCGAIVNDLEHWTGEGAEQEDDITLVVITRTASADVAATVFDDVSADETLATFQIPSIEGNEVLAIRKVAGVVESLDLLPTDVERLKTAVGEAVMNAIEHGNEFNPDLSVTVEVRVADAAVRVRISDHGGDKEIPDAETPDLEAKLAGDQTPRGWGLFLIEKMVDEVRSDRQNGTHTVELVMNQKGGA